MEAPVGEIMRGINAGSVGRERHVMPRVESTLVGPRVTRRVIEILLIIAPEAHVRVEAPVGGSKLPARVT